MAEFIVGHSVRKLARRHPRLRNLLWRIDQALVWCLLVSFRLLPVDAASRLGGRVGRFIGPRLTRKQSLFHENLSRAFPEMSEQQRSSLVLEAWGQVGRVLAEYPHLETILKDDERLEIVQEAPLQLVPETPRPSVIITAHISNWEVVCTAMAKLGMANSSLYSPPTNPFLDAMLARQREALNSELVPRDNCTRPLMRALAQGRSVGLVADRRMDVGKSITFFGQEKISSILAAQLALKFNVDLIPVSVERKRDASYKVTFHRPVIASNPDADSTAQAIDMIQQVHGLYEDWIRRHPSDWFCSKRLWSKVKRNPIGKKQRSATGIKSHAA